MAIRHRELCVIHILKTKTFEKKTQAESEVACPFPPAAWKVAGR